MKQSFFDLSYSDLINIFLITDLNPTGASLIFNHIYKKKKLFGPIHNLSKKSYEYLQENYNFDLPEIITVSKAEDKTVKFLFKLHDKKTIETVLIPFNGKYTICLSSQVGCAMKCSFCFTGTQGLKRNLGTSEIIGQYLVAQKWLTEHRPQDNIISNIVFMGQGEPLHNFDSVKKACEIFLCNHGSSIGHQKITISTSGFIPGLKRWNEEMPGVNLALSLHSPFTDKRNELIPLNKKYPLSEVMEYIDQIILAKKQFITYEYLLIDNFNDSYEDAIETGKLLEGKSAYINLIPFNPFPGTEYKRSSEEKIKNFKVVLDTFKIPTLIRITKGDKVLAACGQLNTI